MFRVLRSGLTTTLRAAQTTPHTLPRRLRHGSGTGARAEQRELNGGKEDVVVVENSSSFDASSPAEIPSLALRDCCPCPECLHPETHQRMVATHTLSPEASQIDSLVLSPEGALTVVWHDGHASSYPPHLLSALADPHSRIASSDPLALDWPPSPPAPQSATPSRFPVPHLGEGEGRLAESVAQHRLDVDVSNARWKEDETQRQILDVLAEHGLVFAVGVGGIEDGDPEPSREFLESLGVLRSTHYGTFWDFSPGLEHGDTAYTTLGLPPHTDGTYFADPPGVQALHCLAHDGEGGNSIMVDGFAALAALQAQDPDAYHILASTPVRWSYKDVSACYTAVAPAVPPALGAAPLRINNDDRTAFPDGDPETVAAFYHAWTQLLALVRDENAPYYASFKLTPGTICLFDNWRTLHGRTSFTGHRRLVGAYYSRQDILSTHHSLIHSLSTSPSS